MKAVSLITSLALAHFSSVIAVPHAKHARIHARHRNPALQVTEIVTVTDYSAIVWVDREGNLISTEYKTHPVTSAVVASPSEQAVSLAVVPPPPSAEPSTTLIPINEAPPKPSSSNTPDIQQAHVHNDDNNNEAGTGNIAPGMGICYDMIDSSGKCKDLGTINSEFGFLKNQGYGKIRVYDIGCNVGDFASAAASVGLKLMAGVNLDNVAEASEKLAKLIAMINGNWASIDTIYVGNELVMRQAASPQQVADAVAAAAGTLSKAGYHGNVVTVDMFANFQAGSTLCSTSSYCAINAHAFFDPNTSPEKAGSFVKNAYDQVQQANPGKKVVITETGWAYAGKGNGAALTGEDNQRTAINSIIKAFGAQASDVFLFQAYNAGYKPQDANDVERHFGLYDSDHYKGGIGG